MNEVGSLLAGRYRLLEKIAAGGSAFIYRARDEKTDRIVAVKILKPELTDNQEFIQRFKKEVQASLKLRHANIIRAYDAGLDDGKYYIVMELVKGTTLKNLIQSEGALPAKYVVSVAKKLCLALEYAHVKGFIHRDIKPHNVLLDEKGEPYIADFGIARNVASNTITSDENSVMGSVHYFSPEQARGERVDKRTDIYSLGILIYEMLTGKVPFDADTSIAIALKHINEPMPDLSLDLPGSPDSLNRIIQKATQKDKHFRYRTAFSMYEDLMRALSDPGGEYVRYTESKRSKQPLSATQFQSEHDTPRRHKVKPAVIILACVAGAALVCLFAVQTFGRIPVPVVIGYDESQARTTLSNAGFSPEVLAEISDEPVGIVVRQDPEAGTSALKGATISVYISEGAGLNRMPNVTDMPYEKARQILSDMGISVSMIEETQGTYSIGYVLEQSPLPGTELAASPEAVLTVKTAPEGYRIPIPSVVGMQLDAGIEELNAAGFSQYVVHEAQETGAEPGSILSQVPSDGEHLSGEAITLYQEPGRGTQYRYDGDVTIRAQDDDTQVQVGIVDTIDGASVYRIIADTTLEEGLHSVPLRSVFLDASASSVDAEMVILLDGTVADNWQVSLERVD